MKKNWGGGGKKMRRKFEKRYSSTKVTKVEIKGRNASNSENALKWFRVPYEIINITNFHLNLFFVFIITIKIIGGLKLVEGGRRYAAA